MATQIYRVSDRRDVFLKKGGMRMFVALEVPCGDPLLDDVSTYAALVWGSGALPSAWRVCTRDWTLAGARACVARDIGTCCAVGIEASGGGTYTVFVCYE